MRKLFKRTVCSLLALSAALCFASCGEPATAKKPEYYKPEKETTADVTAPAIKSSYAYKIVAKGVKFNLPEVSFSENGVTATYAIGETQVTPGAEHVFDEVGQYAMTVTAMDGAGNQATPQKIYFDVVEETDTLSLNKVYAFDTVRGLEAHLGTSDMGNTNVRIHYETVSEASPSEYGIPAVTDEDGNVVSNSFIVLKNYTQYVKMVLNNPLYTHWDEKFEQLYFYVYNAGTKGIRLRFNNYYNATACNTKGSWVKVIVAPKTVTVQGDDPTTPTVETSYQKIVTDYTAISSKTEDGKNPSTSLEGMIDLEDCVGSFIRIDYDTAQDVMAMSAIYGVPVKEAK